MKYGNGRDWDFFIPFIDLVMSDMIPVLFGAGVEKFVGFDGGIFFFECFVLR
jgi:hypothetical protein